MSSNSKSISIKASGSLRKLIPPGTVARDVNTVGEAIEQLSLPEIGEVVIMVNRRMAYWDTEVEDTDGFWAVSPNPTRFTIPAGLGIKRVKLSASVVTNNVAVNEFGELRIKKNGTDTQGLPITRDFENSNIDRRFSVHSGPVSVSDGDYFEVFWLTETDTSTDIANSTYTWFKIEVVETDQDAFPPEQIHFFQHGAPGVSDVLFMKVLNRRTTVNDALAGSEAYALGGANGGAVVYDVKRNGTKIGDVTFANTTGAAAAGTFATQAAQQYVFAVGDRLTIESPANVQSMTDISFNLAGFRS